MKKSSHRPITIDEYIAELPEAVKPRIIKLRQIVNKVAPEAKEVISYGMPAYKYHGMLLYFAAFTNHYSLFAFPNAIIAFKDKLKGYELSKGAIKFPINKPVPVKLVTEIIQFKMQENLNKQMMKDLAKSNRRKSR
jgi:uncharacterized protein YdhG (YjbR/CyaY superfamily)